VEVRVERRRIGDALLLEHGELIAGDRIEGERLEDACRDAHGSQRDVDLPHHAPAQRGADMIQDLDERVGDGPATSYARPSLLGTRSARAKPSATCSTVMGWSRYRPSPSTGTTGIRCTMPDSMDTSSSPGPKMTDGRKMVQSSPLARTASSAAHLVR
jgi:hypothetical protein